MSKDLTDNTAGSTMTMRKLSKIQRDIDSLRARSANIRDHELIGIAGRLGRHKFNRGKEPTFVSDIIPGPAITIPAHGTLKRGTALNILSQFEADIFYWRERLSKDKDASNDHV